MVFILTSRTALPLEGGGAEQKTKKFNFLMTQHFMCIFMLHYLTADDVLIVTHQSWLRRQIIVLISSFLTKALRNLVTFDIEFYRDAPFATTHFT